MRQLRPRRRQMKIVPLGLWFKRLVPVACAVLALMPRPLAAQAVSGTILGEVADTTGAVIPGATVTLTNTGTGFTRSVVSDIKGEYTAPSIPTGTYTVTCEMQGFKKSTVANVVLGVDQKVRIS